MNYVIDQTKTTPRLLLDRGNLTISGKAIPTIYEEFCTEFYSLIEEYLNQPDDFTQINVDLQYVNGCSKKCLARVFYLLDQLKVSGKSVVVNWHYENNDDDMLELGLIYYSMYNLHFNYIRKKDRR
jgi:hypothetical protein